nr:hypothetical protein Iba_chr13dCG3760 [Ipomoea batatas]
MAMCPVPAGDPRPHLKRGRGWGKISGIGLNNRDGNGAGRGMENSPHPRPREELGGDWDSPSPINS